MIFASLLLVVSFSFAFAQQPPPSVSNAVQALRKGEYATALRISDELLRNNPNNPQLLSLRAAVLDRARQRSQAVLAYRHALAVVPNYLPALEGAAELQYRAQSNEAIPLLRRILAIQPSNTTAHAMLGALEARQRQCGPAVQDFAASSTLLSTQPDALMACGVCLAHLKRHPEAVVQFQRLLILRPASWVVCYNLAPGFKLRSQRSAGALHPHPGAPQDGIES